jgi:hypothetical protein
MPLRHRQYYIFLMKENVHRRPLRLMGSPAQLKHSALANSKCALHAGFPHLRHV